MKTENNTSCEERRLLESVITLDNNTIFANDSNETSKNEVIEKKYFSYPVFIYPNDNNEDDQVKYIINNRKYLNLDIINWIVNNITGMPSIANVSEPIVIKRVVPNFLNEGKFNLEPGLNYIKIKNISIDIDGYIYYKIDTIEQDLSFMISNLTNNNTKYQEILSSNNISNQTGNYSFINNINSIFIPFMTKSNWVEVRNANKGQRIFVLGNKTIDITISGLVNGTFYKIFVYATNEEPSYLSPRTTIFSFIQNTTDYEGLTLYGDKIAFQQTLTLTLILVFIFF